MSLASFTRTAPQRILGTQALATLFSSVFLLVSVIMLFTTVASGLSQLWQGADITSFTLKMVNGSVIAIALYELAMVIAREYGGGHDDDVAVMLRRTLPRFIGTVAVALSLEGLIMVIKYSQLDLAGNLYYPVAIIISAACLLIALGIFLHFAPNEPTPNPTP